MFGYIRTDEPYLYKKDEVLYGAIYCGLCKAIGRLCGQAARFGLTYDVAFLSVILHNLSDTDIKIEKQRCAAHWIKRKNMAKSDDVSDIMAALNVIMCYYKTVDDYNDTGKKNIKSALFKNGFKRAVKKYPKLSRLAENCYGELSAHEKNKVASIDIAADPFAKFTANISALVLNEKSSQYTFDLFYYLGKWIYLIDAIDDFDKDKASGEYNVFALAYPDCISGKELFSKYKQEILYTLNSVFWHLKENFLNVKFYFNKDLIENVLIRGIPKKSDEIINKYISENRGKKCQSI